MTKAWLGILLLSLAAGGASKTPPGPASSGNELLQISGSVFLDKSEINSRLGVDPPQGVVVVEVHLVPQGDHKIRISLDDFVLLSNKDGQRCQPMSASQVAGDSVLVVQSSQGGGGIGIGSGMNAPIWGGMGGGRPRRMGGDGQVIGGANAETKATVQSRPTGAEGENQVVARLKELILVEQEITEDTTGLLYFVLDGKQKRKDLELLYKTPSGRLVLDFER